MPWCSTRTRVSFETGIHQLGDSVKRTEQLLSLCFGKLAESGFLGMLVPEEHGGLGFDLQTYLHVLEELAWGDAAVALTVAIHSGPVARESS